MINSLRTDIIQPIISPIRSDILQNEIDSLRDEDIVNDLTEFTVYCVTAVKIPNILLEIGRLREITFRDIGAGSAKAVDTDLYDSYYRHIFVWNKKSQEIICACRIGLSDIILENLGPGGFYVSSLYDIDAHFFHQLKSAVELGRGIVRPEYQGNYLPLTLLFTGVLTWIARHPHYRYIYSLMSISPYYHYRTQQIIYTFLSQHVPLSELACYVRPLHPPPRKLFLSDLTIKDTKKFIHTIKEIEQGKQTLPLLIKRYLKFNIHLISIGQDPDFGNIVDYFFITDLVTTEFDVLKRYMGHEVIQFLKFWDA